MRIAVTVLLALFAISCAKQRYYPLPTASKTLIYPSVQVKTVAGRVVRDGTDETLPGVVVEVFRPNGDKALRISMTDRGGRFKFDLPVGHYVLQFSLLGYDRVRQPVVNSASATEPPLEVGLPLGT